MFGRVPERSVTSRPLGQIWDSQHPQILTQTLSLFNNTYHL